MSSREPLFSEDAIDEESHRHVAAMSNSQAADDTCISRERDDTIIDVTDDDVNDRAEEDDRCESICDTRAETIEKEANGRQPISYYTSRLTVDANKQHTVKPPTASQSSSAARKRIGEVVGCDGPTFKSLPVHVDSLFGVTYAAHAQYSRAPKHRRTRRTGTGRIGHR